MWNRIHHSYLSSVSVAFLCLSILAAPITSGAQKVSSTSSKPRVLVLAVNGAEWDLLRPLLIRGELPNLKKVIENGSWGKLRTVSAPNCP